MYTDDNRWSYQKEAITKITSFFRANSNKKGMLVIPTGGGKTLTALRAINQLYDENIISKKVLWVSHLDQLNNQTKTVLKDQLKKEKFLGHLERINPKLIGVCPEMKSKASSTIKLKKKEFDLVVVDEAHHSPAESYRLIIGSGLPVLGLTATPTRLDGLSMPYEPIFQVTPAELFRRGVIIKPKIFSFETKMTYNISDISTDAQFNILNNPQRNRMIVEEIFNYKNIFSKVIVFVRTKDHARDLKKLFSHENFKTKYYEKIGYILGGDQNDEGIKNKEYLEKNKKYDKSIIINCGVLTEGFDDPSINTTVMACPSKSTTFIMQCVGRALRRNPNLDDLNQKKNMVTFSDDLPNVNYRFDNFWMFGEINDSLEPSINKIEYESKKDFQTKLKSVFENKKGLISFCEKINFNIEDIDYDLLDESNIILYNFSAEDDGNKWGLIYFNNLPQKNFYLDKYNWLSQNVREYSSKKINAPLLLEARGVKKDDFFLGKDFIKENFWHSIEKSFELITKRGDEKNKINRACYYSFFKTEDVFKNKLKLFVSETLNKDAIIQKIETLEETKVYWVIIVPHTIIGGKKSFIITQKSKEAILDTINYFKEVVKNSPPSEFKNIIDKKKKTYYDLEKNPIYFEQILQIVNDTDKIFQEEKTFLKIYNRL